MGIYRTRYPVQSLDNRLLLPPDTEISEKVLEGLLSRRGDSSIQALNLLAYGSVRNDILFFLRHSPYREIFSDESERNNLLNLMDRVSLILPVLGSLDYFREQDPYTYRHILMVFALSTLLAKDLVADYQELMEETMAGPTHDFGKICVPLKILKKRRPLTLSERHLLEHHAVAGYVLLCYYLKDTQHLAAKVAKSHHERRNGSGYPLGIHLADRLVEIVVASDIYDALISPRPYRPVSYDNRTALEELTEMAERGELGWEVVQGLVAHNRKKRPHYMECDVSLEKRGSPPRDNIYGVIADPNAYSPYLQDSM